MGNDRADPSAKRHRFRPPVPSGLLVERPELVSEILATKRLCVVTAAPGFGATTLVARALREESTVAWVSLEAAGAQRPELWPLVGAALGVDLSRGATVTDVLDLVGDGPLRWLVLDDVDEAVFADETAGLAYFCRHLPQGLRLAITTHRPPASLGLGAGDATVLDHRDLALAPGMGANLLLGLAPQMDVDEVETILELAEGWPAALAAAAHHAARRPGGDTPSWLRTTGADLLFEPWWSRLVERQRRLLLGTAFLSEVRAGLCDAVLESDDATEVLGSLGQPMGHLSVEGEVWRRPRLLLEYLRRRQGPVPVEHHSRAADWLLGAGLVDTGLLHLEAAGRGREAGAVLRAYEDAWFEQGDTRRALSAYGPSAPADALRRLAYLLRVGWAKAFSGDRPGAEAALSEIVAVHALLSRGGRVPGAYEDAEASLADTNLEGEVRLFQAYLASRAGNTAAMVSAARAARNAFADLVVRPSHQLAPILEAQGHLWSGDLESARAPLQRLARLPLTTDLLREAILPGLRADLLTAEGRVHEALVVTARAMAWLASQGISSLATGNLAPYLADAWAKAESGSLGRAAELLQAAIEVADSRFQTGDLVRALTVLARVELARGNLSEALNAVGQGRRALRASAPSSGMAVPLDMMEIRIRLAGGDLVRAERLVVKLPASESRTLLATRVAVRRQFQGANRTLSDFRPSHPRSEADRHLLLAAASLRRSSRLAEAHLAAAADVAVREGMTLLLVGSGPELLDFAEATGRRQGSDALSALVAVARGSEPATPAGPPGTGADLSRGEIELLSLLPGRDTNADIAAQLGVSLNTVKTRLQRLYRKLGVPGRNEAVKIARARNLLPRYQPTRVTRGQ